MTPSAKVGGSNRSGHRGRKASFGYVRVSFHVGSCVSWLFGGDFAEWVASESGAVGHMSREGRDFIHFASRANSLEEAVEDAVNILRYWKGLEVVGLKSSGSDQRAPIPASSPVLEERMAIA